MRGVGVNPLQFSQNPGGGMAEGEKLRDAGLEPQPPQTTAKVRKLAKDRSK